jgi:hypothetical protein
VVTPPQTRTEMATKNKKPSQPLKLGDYVKIKYYPDLRARIVELRGPLGPGGAQVYRVRIRLKPRSIYVELPEGQLKVVPTES